MNIGEETKIKELDQQLTCEYLHINESNGLKSDKIKFNDEKNF